MPVLVAVIALLSVPADARAAPADRSGAPSSAPLAAHVPVADALESGPLQAGGPRLDIEGMRRSVRGMPLEEAAQSRATAAMSGSADAGRERFREKFDSGKRRDCLTAFQGLGLLALVAMPLASLLDKKDHGCKW